MAGKQVDLYRYMIKGRIHDHFWISKLIIKFMWDFPREPHDKSTGMCGQDTFWCPSPFFAEYRLFTAMHIPVTPYG